MKILETDSQESTRATSTMFLSTSKRGSHSKESKRVRISPPNSGRHNCLTSLLPNLCKWNKIFKLMSLFFLLTSQIILSLLLGGKFFFSFSASFDQTKCDFWHLNRVPVNGLQCPHSHYLEQCCGFCSLEKERRDQVRNTWHSKGKTGSLCFLPLQIKYSNWHSTTVRAVAWIAVHERQLSIPFHLTGECWESSWWGNSDTYYLSCLSHKVFVSNDQEMASILFF